MPLVGTALLGFLHHRRRCRFGTAVVATRFWHRRCRYLVWHAFYFSANPRDVCDSPRPRRPRACESVRCRRMRLSSPRSTARGFCRTPSCASGIPAHHSHMRKSALCMKYPRERMLPSGTASKRPPVNRHPITEFEMPCVHISFYHVVSTANLTLS